MALDKQRRVKHGLVMHQSIFCLQAASADIFCRLLNRLVGVSIDLLDRRDDRRV
jgi:hypothetical protein